MSLFEGFIPYAEITEETITGGEFDKTLSICYELLVGEFRAEKYDVLSGQLKIASDKMTILQNRLDQSLLRSFIKDMHFIDIKAN
jgi:hypothetical protein